MLDTLFNTIGDNISNNINTSEATNTMMGLLQKPEFVGSVLLLHGLDSKTVKQMAEEAATKHGGDVGAMLDQLQPTDATFAKLIGPMSSLASTTTINSAKAQRAKAIIFEGSKQGLTQEQGAALLLCFFFCPPSAVITFGNTLMRVAGVAIGPDEARKHLTTISKLGILILGVESAEEAALRKQREIAAKDAEKASKQLEAKTPQIEEKVKAEGDKLAALKQKLAEAEKAKAEAEAAIAKAEAEASAPPAEFQL